MADDLKTRTFTINSQRVSQCLCDKTSLVNDVLYGVILLVFFGYCILLYSIFRHVGAKTD